MQEWYKLLRSAFLFFFLVTIYSVSSLAIIVNPSCSINGCSMQGDIYMNGYSIYNATINQQNVTNSSKICLNNDCISTWFSFDDITGTKLNLTELNVSGKTILSSGKLGIGTANPTYEIDVVGVIKASSSVLASTATLSNNYIVSSFGGLLTIGNSNSGGSLDIVGSGIGDSAIRIDNSNNIGIGTTNPTSKLDIIGNLRVANSSGTEGLYVSNDGKVGIGTTSPSNDLTFGSLVPKITTNTVDGNDNAYFSMSGGGTISNTRGGFFILAGNENPTYKGNVLIRPGSAPNMSVELDQILWAVDSKVGIGTNSPDTKLKVAGSINVTGDIYYDGSLIPYSPIMLGHTGETTKICMIDTTGAWVSLWSDKGIIKTKLNDEECITKEEINIARRVCENSDLSFDKESLSCVPLNITLTR